MDYKDAMKDSLSFLDKYSNREIHMIELSDRLSYNEDFFGYLYGAFFEIPISEYIKKKPKEKEAGIKIPGGLPFEREVPYPIIQEWYEQTNTIIIEGQPFTMPNGKKEMALDQIAEIFQKLTSNKNYTAIWQHDGQYHFSLLIGRETTQEKKLSEQHQLQITIPAHECAVFSTKWTSDQKQMAEVLKILIKYALFEWEEKNERQFDNAQYHYIRRIGQKAYLYVPVLPAKDAQMKKSARKVYSVDSWPKYIDSHIKENLTPERVAKTFHYSYQHFRYEFHANYKITVSDYIRKRKLQMAAEEIRNGKAPKNIYEEYGFSSYDGFSRAFQKEFHTSPKNYSKAVFKVVNLNQYYTEYKDQLKITYIKIPELKMIGQTVIPGNGVEVDIPAQISYWLEKGFPCMENTRFAYNKKRREDKIAMWYLGPEYEDIQYILGPVVKNFENTPKDMVEVILDAGYYMIFETERTSDRDKLTETLRMFTRCINYGWIKEYKTIVDLKRFTFDRFVDDKIYHYVPIKKEIPLL